MFYTTLALVRKYSKEGYEYIRGKIGTEYSEDTLIPLNVVLDYGSGYKSLRIVVNCLLTAVVPSDLFKEAEKICWCFAADCFEHLPACFEDDTSREAINVMRKYPVGKSTLQDVSDAWEEAFDYVSPFGDVFNLTWALGMLFLITTNIMGTEAHTSEVQWQKERLRTYLSPNDKTGDKTP